MRRRRCRDPRGPVLGCRERLHDPAVSDLHRAVALAALADADEVEYAYWSAVAEGAANTRTSAEHERSLGALRLLTLATLRLRDLALQASLLDVGDHPFPEAVEVALEAACETGAGALRLAHRALEAHAREIGYDLIAWISHALERTRATLAEIEPGLVEGGGGAHVCAGPPDRRRPGPRRRRDGRRRPARTRRDRDRARPPARPVHDHQRGDHHVRRRLEAEATPSPAAASGPGRHSASVAAARAAGASCAPESSAGFGSSGGSRHMERAREWHVSR